MPITTAWANSAKPQLLGGDHILKSAGSGGHSVFIALYSPTADLGSGDTTYKTAGEVVGVGYTAGGQQVVITDPVLQGAAGIGTVNNIVWSASTIEAAGCMFYNATFGLATITVHSFGANIQSNNGDFTVIIPPFTEAEALWRIV